nr:MAG TPA: hypothetical protein [Caudoviricetes sp.]
MYVFNFQSTLIRINLLSPLQTDFGDEFINKYCRIENSTYVLSFQ